MDKFSKEEIELLVFHEVIKPLNPDIHLTRYWKFPEYSKFDIRGFKKVLESINNNHLADEIERELYPTLTHKLLTRETDFNRDFIDIIDTARNRKKQK